MKQILSLILTFCIFLSGCSSMGERIKEPVTFYYPRTEYSYFSSDGVIVSEDREASGHRDDLNYLLVFYLMGPTQEGLQSPLPATTKIISLSDWNNELIMQITNYDSTISDADFSLACACISMTCFELTDYDTVTIKSGTRSVSISRDTVILYDSGTNNLEVNK